jgi:hypothetical protein
VAFRYRQADLERQVERAVAVEPFFGQAPAMPPAAALVTGVVCGVRVEDVEDPLMREIRCPDKLVDEPAKGEALDGILRR